jgi:hypothetical protein
MAPERLVVAGGKASSGRMRQQLAAGFPWF